MLILLFLTSSQGSKLMQTTAGGALMRGTAPAGRRAAGNDFPVAVCGKEGDFTGGVLGMAFATGYGRVGFAHRPEFFKDVTAIQTEIFIYWHRFKLLRCVNSNRWIIMNQETPFKSR